jgi:predicted Rossmann fold flavoprotein
MLSLSKHDNANSGTLRQAQGDDAKNFDVIIIGAGAAGLMCAATASARGLKVLLVDHAKAVGEKIRISGGGRCNFTNIHTTPKNFISNNPHFCVSALKRFTPQDFISLIKKHEIAFHEKTLGQLFCDFSSKQIIEMLLKECGENVEIILEKSVSEIRKSENIFEMKVGDEAVQAASLVIATGGPSIPKMGASSFGYEIARQFKLKIIQPIPALVPLTFAENLLAKTKNLSGVAMTSEVSCGKVKFHEAVLFTHRGISGPAILQISSYWSHGEKITINFAPQTDVFSWLQDERKNKPKQEIQNILAQILPRSFVNFVIEEVGHHGFLADMSNQKFKEIANFINAWSVIPNGTEGFAKAEVTKGGIDTDEISSKTFEAKKVSGLFFIGEVLDVTGWLGGYNFQWAWASGKAAGLNLLAQ